jgi:hypothetical protein
MSPKFGARSRWSSQPNILRYSLGSGEVAIGEDVIEDDIEGAQLRPFRPKSSQGDVSHLDVNSDVEAGHIDTSDGLPVNNPQALQVEEDTPNSPSKR